MTTLSTYSPNVKHIGAFLFAILVTLLVVLYGDQLRSIAGLGYASAFASMLIGNATVFLPAPALFFIYALGSQLNPLLIGASGAIGGALGEVVGFLLGYSGNQFVEKSRIYKRFHTYVEKYGVMAIVVLAVIPNPLFDMVGIIAGALKIPLWKFFIAALLGIFIKVTIIAYAGAYSLTWVEQLWIR